MQLPAHHAAWLARHPDRSEGWLWTKLKEGFEVHHVDNDHSNNDPANLILIDGDDHRHIHALAVKISTRRQEWRDWRLSEEFHECCEEAYRIRLEGASWRVVAEKAYFDQVGGHTARRDLLEWCDRIGRPHPPPVDHYAEGRDERLRDGNTAYLNFLFGMTWREIDHEMFEGRPGMAFNRAKSYAKSTGLDFPPQRG